MTIAILFYRKRRKFEPSDIKKETAIKKLVLKQYNSLGPISFHETMVLFSFLAMVFLWIFREPEFLTGWGKQFEEVFGDKM